MRRLTDLWYRLRAIFDRRRMERDLDEEVAFHIEMETRKNVEAGMEPREARRRALVGFGGEDRFKERARESWGVSPLHDLGGDLRFAARQLLRNPAFGLLAVLTLALGIGGTVALWSVVNDLVLRPLPVPDDREVVVFYHDYNWRGSEFDFAKERVETFASLAAFSNSDVVLRAGEASSIVLATVASVELFDVMDVTPLLGRGFQPGEDRPGADPVIVLSHGLWQREFGGDPDVVGRRVGVDGEPTTIVGVMPEGFYFPTPDMEAWVPLDLDPSDPAYAGRGWLVLAGRLGEGAADERVQEDLDRLAAALGERFDYPERWDKSRNPYVETLREYVLGDVRPALLLLLGAVGLVLLMACANVAALVLTRTADRGGEMSVRAALGAGRGRLARQVLTEAVLLGVVAGVVGLLLAVALFDLLVAGLPLGSGFAGTLSLDWSVLLVGMALAVGTGALVSLAPLRGLLRGDLSRGVGGERRSGGVARGTTRLQGALVVAEVLLAVVLATGAGLLVRTVEELRSVDAGLDPEGVLVADVLLPTEATDPAERADFFRRLVERSEALPGVEAAGLVNRAPIRDGGYQGSVVLEGRPDLTGDRRPTSFYRTVTPGTFDALGVEVVRGRGILPDDRADGRPVAVINETFARNIWGGEDPVGRRILENGWTDEPVEVVGVVRNVAVHGLEGEVPMAAYYPWAQTMAASEYGSLVLRTGPDPEGLAGPVRALIAELDGRATTGRVTTMDEIVDAAMAEPLRLRFYLGLFGALGIVLGAVGVYGVVSYAVQRRRSELGIRIALGARPPELLREVVRRGMAPVVLGVAGGLAVALAGSRVLAGFLYGVGATDPAAFLAAAGALLATGLVAALVPAYRATRTDPSESLRVE